MKCNCKTKVSDTGCKANYPQPVKKIKIMDDKLYADDIHIADVIEYKENEIICNQLNGTKLTIKL